VIAGIAALLAAIAAFEHEYVTAVALAAVFGVIGLRAVQECASSMRAVSDSLQHGDPEPESAKDNRVFQPSHASA
jgi:hypothetical protein